MKILTKSSGNLQRLEQTLGERVLRAQHIVVGIEVGGHHRGGRGRRNHLRQRPALDEVGPAAAAFRDLAVVPTHARNVRRVDDVVLGQLAAHVQDLGDVVHVDGGDAHFRGGAPVAGGFLRGKWGYLVVNAGESKLTRSCR